MRKIKPVALKNLILRQRVDLYSVDAQRSCGRRSGKCSSSQTARRSRLRKLCGSRSPIRKRFVWWRQSKRKFLFRWLPIFILITAWRWRVPKQGLTKSGINPGNIGSDDRVKAVADCCRQRGIPIRVGVNSGSLEKHILEKYGSPTPEALVESALYHVRLLEKFDFDDIVISIKSSTVPLMVRAYELLAEQCDYPLHLGVTEAGTERMGLIKSSIGIGSLLLKGIGDTIRVSLTADPVREIYAAKDILKALDLHTEGCRSFPARRAVGRKLI